MSMMAVSWHNANIITAVGMPVIWGFHFSICIDLLWQLCLTYNKSMFHGMYIYVDCTSRELIVASLYILPLLNDAMFSLSICNKMMHPGICAVRLFLSLYTSCTCMHYWKFYFYEV